MTQFKVGDRVRVTNIDGRRSKHAKVDAVGKIARVGVGYDWRVVFADGFVLAVDESEIELVAFGAPKVGDVVRVVLEGPVLEIENKLGFSVTGFYWLHPDNEAVKSVEIIEKAKPSVADLPVGSVVKSGAGSVYQKVATGDWRKAGYSAARADAEIDVIGCTLGWTLLVEKSE